MTKVFDKHWFKEHQRTLLSLVNSPIGGVVRRGLWIEDKKHPVLKITPESVHVLLPNGDIRATIYSNKQYKEAIHRNYKPIWETFHWWDMRLANRLMPAWNVGFDTYSSQPDDTTGVDTFLNSVNTTTNYATDVELGIGERNDSDLTVRSLIKFDLSTIPSNSVTSSNILSLYITRDLSSNARDASMYRVLRNWVESQATWNNWSSGNAWTTAGCGSDGNDADLTNVHATCSFTATESAGTEKQFSISTTHMDNFINGTYSNYGWLIRMATETNDAYYCDSSSSVTASERPKLVITYTSASAQVIWFS